MDTPTAREELLARIADAEQNGAWPEASRLKAALLRLDVPAPDPAREVARAKEIGALRATIASLESGGKFAAAAPRKSELLALLRKQ
jgi:hypothetical protein